MDRRVVGVSHENGYEIKICKRCKVELERKKVAKRENDF
jgi:hypothetical protein